MRNMPRILPLVGIAAAGVLAVNALAGARSLPDLLSATKAMAEGVAKPAKAAKGAKAGKDARPDTPQAASAAAPDAQVAPSVFSSAVDAAGTTAPRAAPICAPTAAELAKEAGLSPAELQVLQSLGARRGQLDQRETDLNTQLALMAAAEAKLDAKVKSMNALKADIQGLMGQADAKQQAEVDRMVKVFEGMKPKDSAVRMVVLDDSVRLPIAAKMKERALSAMLAQMPPMEAKKLTEALSKRFTNIRTVAAGADQAATAAAANVPVPPTTSPPAAADPTAAKAAPAKATSSKPAPAKARKPAPKKKPAAKPAAAKADAAEAAPAKAATPAPTPSPAPAKPAPATPAPTPAPAAAKPGG
jgi:flagellar motility protein MotE (MotC chaperone)